MGNPERTDRRSPPRRRSTARAATRSCRARAATGGSASARPATSTCACPRERIATLIDDGTFAEPTLISRRMIHSISRRAHLPIAPAPPAGGARPSRRIGDRHGEDRRHSVTLAVLDFASWAGEHGLWWVASSPPRPKRPPARRPLCRCRQRRRAHAGRHVRALADARTAAAIKSSAPRRALHQRAHDPPRWRVRLVRQSRRCHPGGAGSVIGLPARAWRGDDGQPRRPAVTGRVLLATATSTRSSHDPVCVRRSSISSASGATPRRSGPGDATCRRVARRTGARAPRRLGADQAVRAPTGRRPLPTSAAW